MKYFGWAPKIPWKMNNGFVNPNVPMAAWSKAIDIHNPIVVCNGGPLEAYCSTMYFEMLNMHFPGKKLLWSGSPKYSNLIAMNGLAGFAENRIDDETLSRFPTPIFMDRLSNCYLNCLSNYIYSYPISTGDRKKNYRPLVKQMAANMTQPWQELYMPQIRNWGNVPQQVAQWAKVHQFDMNRPFALITPDVGTSIHPQSALGWSDMELKAFTAMASQAGIQTLICSSKPQLTQTAAWFCKAPIEWQIYFATKAKAVLSEQVDMLIIALFVNPVIKVLSKKLKSPWSIKQNGKFLGRTDIYELGELSPYWAFQTIMGKNDL